ncbi:V-set domain-containing T-cell activation inhibitor 1 [Ambystoma mexicanum]|uniref:V-set domain-containing T-cell activation inhibitor 1 n=1 Tax=Ambystoma mexicanum TaxID=8296 RepID=UPI0037E87C0F
MASAGNIIFWSMIAIIIILVGLIALIIGFGVSGNNSNTVKASTSVGRIGDDGILQCTFTPDIKQNNIILWEKQGISGIVHLYDNGKDLLKEQNDDFTDRTELFPTQVGTGNASLKLSDVKLEDAGTYVCTVTTSAGKASGKMDFKVGYYSEVVVTSPRDGMLLCESEAWYPQPTVSWINATSGANLTQDADYTPETGLDIAWMVNSELNITRESQYTCVVKNQLAVGNATAMVKDSGKLLTDSSLQILSAAPHQYQGSHIQCLLLPILGYLLTLL